MKKFGINQSKVASRVVYGPGSMFGESHVKQLCGMGMYKDAATFAEEHNRQIPPRARRISQGVIDTWRSYGNHSTPKTGAEHD